MASENDQGRRFFTTSEVANYCAVTNDGVLKWIKSGKLRAFSTPGGHYRVSAEDFRAFLEKYDIPSTSPSSAAESASGPCWSSTTSRTSARSSSVCSRSWTPTCGRGGLRRLRGRDQDRQPAPDLSSWT